MTSPEAICKLTAFLHLMKSGRGVTPEDIAIAQTCVQNLAANTPCQVPEGAALEGWLKTFGNTPPPPPPYVPPPPYRNEAPRQHQPKGVNLEVEKFIQECKSLLNDCDDIPDKGSDFAESVSEKIRNIMTTVEEMGLVTDNQRTAVENMGRGISRWIH